MRVCKGEVFDANLKEFQEASLPDASVGMHADQGVYYRQVRVCLVRRKRGQVGLTPEPDSIGVMAVKDPVLEKNVFKVCVSKPVDLQLLAYNLLYNTTCT